MRAADRSPDGRSRAALVLLAVLLLAIRLAASSLPMPMDAVSSRGVASLLDAVQICHAGKAGDESPSPAPSRAPPGHEHDCGLCPICAAVALFVPPAGNGAPHWVLATGEVVAYGVLEPPATGPPIRPGAASPRGPPGTSV